MALKAQAQFTNPYERAHATYSSSPYFNENAWKQIASGGDASNLDMYIYALDKNTKELSYDKFKHRYDLSLGNTDTYLAALYNEAFASHTANDDRYQVNVYKYDDAGNMLYDENGNPKVEKKTVSEYEYNKMVINQQAENLRKEFLEKTYRQERDPGVWGAVGETIVDVAYDGIIEFFNKLGTAVYTVGEMMFTDKTFSEDWFSSWESNYKPVLERIVVDDTGKTAADVVEENERKYSSWRDDNGNYTTVGRWANGIATTSGEILASTLLSGIVTSSWSGAAAGTGARATAAKIATDIISTGIYYTPMAIYSMGEQYKEITASGGSVTAGQMFRNQLLKTGLEIAIERTLGGIFGKTDLDKMLFGEQGGKIASKFGKANFSRGVLHVLGEAGQEGLEEFLQEWSGFFVDNCYGMIVDSDFKQEFNLQNFIDAAVIGALTSGVHSMIGVAATKTREITDADGKTHKLGKFASHYYNANIGSLSETLKKAMNGLDALFKTMPYNSRVEYLTKQRTEIENALNDIKNREISESGQMLRYEQAIATETGLGDGYALNENLELIKSHEQAAAKDQKRKDELSKKLADINSQLKSLEDVKNVGKEFAEDEKAWLAQLDKTDVISDFADDATRSSIIQHFDKLYAAAAAIQSFGYAIGEARLVAAEKILTEIKKLGAEGKFDVDSVAKARREMIKELKLSGVAVEKSLTGKIVRSGITKIKHIFKRNDVEENGQVNLPADKAAANKFARDLYKACKELDAVVISEDGKDIAADKKTFIAPENIAEAGAAVALYADAEQRLIDTILNYNFKGDVINRITTVYKALHKEDATPYEAVQAVLFNENFFLTMLTGENGNGLEVSIADTDMFQFLSSLADIIKAVVPKDIRDSVYKTRLEGVYKSMAKSLTRYLKIQPNADYNLDILSPKQKEEIKQIREGYAFANRIVAGTATTNDLNLMWRKIDALSLTKEQKDAAKKIITEGNRNQRRELLSGLDASYRVAFYGAYDGKTYMPTVSLKNRAFNQILYDMGLTCETLVDAKFDETTTELINRTYTGTDQEKVVQFINSRFEIMTSRRYSLRVIIGTADPNNGSFKSGKLTLRIVDNKSSFDAADIESVRNPNEKTHIRPSSRHSTIVNTLLKPDVKTKGAGYYTIDDVITNPELLREDILKTIRKDYLEATPDTVYKFLKNYLPKKGKLTVTIGADGRAIIADVRPIEAILADDFSIQKVKGVIAGKLSIADLVDPKFRVEMLNDVKIVIGDERSFYTETSTAGKHRGEQQGIIKLDKSAFTSLEELKTAFSHELQHVIQEATRMNTGLDGNVLGLFDSDVANKIIADVQKRVPRLFEGVKDQKKIIDIVNSFLYYGSGEVAAYGAETSDIASLYPILVTEDAGKTSIVLPWGNSYESKSKSSQQMTNDRVERTKRLIFNINEGAVNINELTDIIDEIFSINPSISVPAVLKNKILAAYKSSYGDGDIKFVSQSEIDAIKNDRKYSGLYSEADGVLISRDAIIFRLLNNDYQNAAKTILHELVHAVTYREIKSVRQILGDIALNMFLEHGFENPSMYNLSDVQRAALSLIKLHHDLSKNEKQDIYPLKDAYEMVAELVNPNFRNYLKGKSLLSKLFNFIKKLFGIKANDALEAADIALNEILEYRIDEKLNTSNKHYLDIAKAYVLAVKAYKQDDTNLKKYIEMDRLETELASLIEAKAAANGFYSSPLYHGTNRFGFTRADVTKSDDKISFFTTDNFLVAKDYAETNTHKTASERSIAGYDVIEMDQANYKNLINTLLDDFKKYCYSFLENYASTFSKNDFYNSIQKSINDFIDNYWTKYSDLSPIEIVQRINEIINLYYNESNQTEDLTDLIYDIESLRDDLRDVVADYCEIGVYKFYANLDNALTVDANGSKWDEINFNGETLDTRDLFKKAKDAGYSAVIIKNVIDNASHSLRKSDVYIFAEPEHQLASADLVTYDDNGEIIPLSRRFQQLVQDLRWDIAEDNEWLGDADETQVEETEDEKLEREKKEHKKKPKVHTKGRKGRVYVGQRKNKGTPLEPFSNQLDRRVHEDLIPLIMNSPKYEGLNPVFKSKIDDGTLTIGDVYDFIRQAELDDEGAEETFKLINDTIFHNKHIQSLRELHDYVYNKSAIYYGIRQYLIDTGHKDLVMDIENPKAYDVAMDLLENDPKNKNDVDAIIREYWDIGPHEPSLKLAWLRYFDGSIYKGGYVASSYNAMAKYGKEVVSSSKKFKGFKTNGVPVSKQEREDLNAFINEISNYGKIILVMRDTILQDFVRRLNAGEKLTREDYDREVANEERRISELRNLAARKNATAKDRKAYLDEYARYVQDEDLALVLAFRDTVMKELGLTDNDKSLEELAKELDHDALREIGQKTGIRLRKNIAENFRHMTATINNNLNREQRKLFVKDNDDLFELVDGVIKIKTSAYKDEGGLTRLEDGTVVRKQVNRLKDADVLLEIENRVKQLSKEVRKGAYNSDEALKFKKDYEKKIAKFKRDYTKLLDNKTKEVIRYVNVGGQEFGIGAPRNPPPIVQRFLDRVSYSNLTATKSSYYNKSTTQLLTEENEYHVKMSYTEFLERNAGTLHNLTQDEVNKILDWFLSTSYIAGSTAYSSIEMFTLGYFMQMSGSKDSLFVLSDDQLNKIEERFKLVVPRASTILATWKSVLKQIKPSETIHKAMLKACEIELSVETEAELIKAIQSGDIEEINKARSKAYDEVVDRYKGRKRTIFDRILQYEQLALLSGPGTWVRNWIGNKLNAIGNDVSETIALLLPRSKKAERLNQYKIIGTKIDPKYATWIENTLVKTGMLDLWSDGFTKYDPRTSKSNNVDNKLAKLVTAKIEADLFNNASFTNPLFKSAQKILLKLMSDRGAIDKAFKKYLGKMLTEDNVDVSNMNTQLMNTIADAYVMALEDYMHKPSAFAKIENALRLHLQRRYSPEAADGIYFMYKQLFPFANASWNWFTAGLNYTPLGLAKAVVDFARLETTVNKINEARSKGEKIHSARFAEFLARRNIGKGILGSVGFGIGALLYCFGLVGIDDDDDEYKLKITMGDKPVLVDISDLFGTSGILMGISIFQGFADEKAAFAVFGDTFNTMLNDSTFADLYNLFRGTTGPGEALIDKAMDIPSMMWPNFLKVLGNTITSFNKRKVSYSSGVIGWLQRLAVQTWAPWSYLMPYAVNPYTGEPEVVNGGMFAANLINVYSPIDVKAYNYGDRERIAVNVGVRKSQLTGRYKIDDADVTLSREDALTLNQFYGKLNAKDLDDFMFGRTKYAVEDEDGDREELSYSKMTDKQKKAVIERIMSNNSQLAKVYILTSSHGYKYYASDSEYERLRAAGVIRGVYREIGKNKGFVKN